MPDFTNLFSGLFESITFAIRIVDAGGEVVFANQEYCRLFGYNREELLGESFTKVLSPEVKERALSIFKKRFSEELNNSSPVYWSAMRKEGEKFMVAVSSYNIQLENGEKFRLASVRNVSSIIKSQNQLEFQASILDSVQESIFVVGVDEKIQYWNKGACNLYGFSEEQALGENISKVVPNLQALELIHYFQEKDRPFNLADRSFKRPDNSEVYIDTRISPLYDSFKTITGFIFVCKDVTDQRKYQEELQDQRNWMTSLLESQSSFLARLTSSGILTYGNRSFLRYTGFTDGLQGKSFQDYISTEDVQAWVEILDELRKVNHARRFEFRMLKEDGNYSWVNWEFVPLYGGDGNLFGIQGVGVDISHRKKTEQERDNLLRETQALNEELQANEEELRQNLERTVELKDYIEKNEKKFKSLLENSFESVILFNEPGVILYASPSVKNTLGYSPEEMIGKKGMSFVHEEDRLQSKALLGQMVEKAGNRIYIVQRIRRKNGKYIWIESYSTNLLHDENVQGIVSNFRDITERKEAEERIKQSEASLLLAQHIAKLGSTEFDLLSGRVTNSPEVYAIYDYDLKKFPEDQFKGEQYIHPADVHKFRDLFESSNEFGQGWLEDMSRLPGESLEEMEAAPFEFRIISAEGRLKYLKSRHRFYTDESGRAKKLIVTIQDISEEKHRKHLLDETSRISRIGGWELDLVNNKVFWTKQTYSLFEVSPEEDLSIERAIGFYHHDFQPALQSAFQSLVTEGSPFDLELKMTTATQKELWVRLTGEGEVVNNKVVLAKGTMQDITEKKESEREVQEYADRLRLATEAAGIGIWDWDLEKNKMVWDGQMRKLYHIPEEQEEVGFEDYKKLLHPDDIAEQEELLQEVLQEGKLESQFRILTPDSEIRWIKSFAKVFLNEVGEPGRMIGVNWDITPLKQTEETLRMNNDELLKTNEELDHFVYSTSHNLRAPLTSILGIVNLMKHHSNMVDNVVYIDLIEKSVIKLDETIQDITNYSRNTRIEVNLELVQFEPLIQSIVESLSFLENAKRIRISYIAPTNTHFYSDSSRLKMIFTNLVSNAIKYSDITQSDPYIFINIEQQNQGICIRIKDNGIGIAEEHQKKIFNMFFRASTKSTGSGLGLYIVKEAVRKLGGTIEVNSELAKGTEFIIRLPDQV